MAPQMGLIGLHIAQGYKIAYMALLGPFWPVGILLKRYNEVILEGETALFRPVSPYFPVKSGQFHLHPCLTLAEKGCSADGGKGGTGGGQGSQMAP